MPTIAYFYGISIMMFFNEHPPPHFSAGYSGHEAKRLDRDRRSHRRLSSCKCRASCEAMSTGASERTGG
jgi:hypothetical protein